MSIVKGYVQTDLGQIHYRKKEGEGLPIVCFHQTASSSAMFEAFMAEFAGSNPIIALDTPGFGGSYDPIDEPTMDQYADQMVDAMRALDIAGEMRVQQLKLKGVVMEDVRLVSRASAGAE